MTFPPPHVGSSVLPPKPDRWRDRVLSLRERSAATRAARPSCRSPASRARRGAAFHASPLPPSRRRHWHRHCRPLRSGSLFSWVPPRAPPVTPQSTIDGRRLRWPMWCATSPEPRGHPSRPRHERHKPLREGGRGPGLRQSLKQRYFTKVGDDYFAEPAQWDVTHRLWRRYFVENGTDWWATLYLAGQHEAADRPSRRLSLSWLRRSHEASRRVERCVSAATGRRRARRASYGGQHREPGPNGR